MLVLASDGLHGYLESPDELREPLAMEGDEGVKACRTTDIMADATHAILVKPSREFTGNFLIDDTFLYGEGVRDFDKYRVDPTRALMPDFFVPEDVPPPPGVTIGAAAGAGAR